MNLLELVSNALTYLPSEKKNCFYLIKLDDDKNYLYFISNKKEMPLAIDISEHATIFELPKELTTIGMLRMRLHYLHRKLNHETNRVAL